LDGPLDVRVVLLEEDSDPIGLLVGPAHIASEPSRNFSGGDIVHQHWDFLKKLVGVPTEIWKETVGTQDGQNDDCQIGFQNVRPSEIFEEKRMSLQKPDDRMIGLIRYAKRIENTKTMITERAT
jgi:hypothetical protein